MFVAFDTREVGLRYDPNSNASRIKQVCIDRAPYIVDVTDKLIEVENSFDKFLLLTDQAPRFGGPRPRSSYEGETMKLEMIGNVPALLEEQPPNPGATE